MDAAGKFTPAAVGTEGVSRPEPLVEPVGQGRFRIGIVTFDQAARTVTIPARVNMREGGVEYALVTEQGKRHEAIFSTEARPEHIHLGCLLLGQREAALAGAVPTDAAVSVEVAWETNGPEKRVPLAECVALAKDSPDQPGGATLSAGPWLYNGSRIDAAGFAAAREGSLISIIRDEAALLNNPRADRDNDEIHIAHAALLPRVGMPVRILLTLPPAAPR